MIHLHRLATALTLAAASSLASATVVIDEFSDDTPTVIYNGGLFETTAVQAGSMIGGARFDGLLCYFACDYNAPYVATLTVGGGTLGVTPPPEGLATTRVLWGNVTPGNNPFPFTSLALDLSGESAFRLEFGPVSDDLLVQFVVVSAGGQSVYSPVPGNPGVVLPAGASQTLMLAFAEFTGSAMFDDVSGLGLVLGGNNGAGTEEALASFSLDSVIAVPEPGAGALFAAGLLAMGAFLARRRRPQAIGQTCD